MLKHLLLLILITCFYNYTCAQTKDVDSTSAKWIEDIQYFSAKMKKYHKNLYHDITEKKFDSMVNALTVKVPTLHRHEIIVELSKIEAAVKDGHTSLNVIKDPKTSFTVFPVRFYIFDDGIYIRSADNLNKHLIGSKVVKVDGMSIDEVMTRLSTIIGSDNEYGSKYFQSIYVSFPEILNALKISKSIDSTEFLLEKDGSINKIFLKPVYKQEVLKGDMDTYWINPEGWSDARGINPALWLQAKKGEKYRMQFLSDDKILYVQLNEINDKENDPETLLTFYKNVFKALDSTGAEKLVIDLRLNAGGNGSYNKPLLLQLIRSRINEKGKFFAITGRRTFSAAQMLVTQLQTFTNVILVGEPTGSKANHYGDARKIMLPNSGITARASTLYHQMGSASEESNITGPDLYVKYTYVDYVKNIDPCMEAIKHYVTSKTLVEVMDSLLKNSTDSLAVTRAYLAYKTNPVNKYVNTKVALRDLGSNWFNKQKYKEAAFIFSLNAAEYNTYRENYLAGWAFALAGDKARANFYYQKALLIDPEEDEVKMAIGKLKVDR